MTRRYLGYLMAAAMGACFVAFGADLAAQLMQFTDGTFGTKVALFDVDGNAITTSNGRISGSFVLENGAAVTGRNNSIVEGCVEHDLAGTQCQPVQAGAVATTSISGNTMVATSDMTRLYAGIDGVGIMRPHANLEDRVSAVVGVTDGSSTSLVASQGSGLRFCATNFIVSNSSATNVTVDIRDGTAGSVIATIPAAANMGGAAIDLGVPLCTTAATAMAMDPSASASTVTVTAIGFKTKL